MIYHNSPNISTSPLNWMSYWIELNWIIFLIEISWKILNLIIFCIDFFGKILNWIIVWIEFVWKSIELNNFWAKFKYWIDLGIRHPFHVHHTHVQGVHVHHVQCSVFCGRGCVSLESEKGKGKKGLRMGREGTTRTSGVLRGPLGPKK